MKGNFRTMKGNPLPPVQPGLGNSPLPETAPSNAAAGVQKRVSFITKKKAEVICQGLHFDGI